MFDFTRHSCLTLSILAAGCVGPGLDDVATHTSAIETMNGLTVDPAHAEIEQLMFNAVSTHGAASDALITMPLATATFTAGGPLASALLVEQLRDPYAQTLMRYVVGCALTPAQVVTYTDTDEDDATVSMTWKGELGLCPGWNTGPANADCQQRVSACLAARVNAFGEKIPITLRGKRDSYALLPVSSTEVGLYPWQEGAFWGNLFGAANVDPGVTVRVDAYDVVYDLKLMGGGEIWYPRADRDLAHTDFVNTGIYTGTVYPSLYACWSPIWYFGDAYAQRRVCAGPDAERCAAVPVGNCGTPSPLSPQGYPSNVCTPSLGGHHGSCSYPSTSLWPLTVYLREPCDIVDTRCDVIR